MGGEMDFRPRPSAAFAGAFSQLLDAAIKEDRDAKDAAYRATSNVVSRPGIGAGRLGNECLRAIGYEYFRTPKDEGRDFSGQLYRVFDRGHMHEAKMLEYLRLAGFTVLDTNAAGKQFRYDIAQYEDGKGRVKGFIDGVITAGPPLIVLGDPEQTCQAFRLNYPMNWENKELNNKNYNKMVKGGLRAYGGDYFPQVQMGMFHLGLTDNPTLFTAKNADTQEVYAELIPFDASFTQAIIDKIVRVIDAPNAEFLPKVATKATDFRCKFCDYSSRCWSEPSRPTVDYGTSLFTNEQRWTLGRG